MTWPKVLKHQNAHSIKIKMLILPNPLKCPSLSNDQNHLSYLLPVLFKQTLPLKSIQKIKPKPYK